MKRKIGSWMVPGTVCLFLTAATLLVACKPAEACGVRRRARAHRVVIQHAVAVSPRPVVVRYVPAYHTDCVLRSGYYYHPRFGYHRHVYHPGGIYFGVHLVF